MFGFSSKSRGQKNLLAAFELILIGRKDDRTRILQGADGKMAALADKVQNGANPYEVAAKVVQDHILAELKKCSDEERKEYLRFIADNNFKNQPNVFELISHVNYCLMILEDKSKPLIPVGSAEGFLVTICRWFGTSEKMLARVYAYFHDSTQHHRYHLQQTRKKNERGLG